MRQTLTIALIAAAAGQAQAEIREYNIFAVPSAAIEAQVAETAGALGAYGLESFHARGFVTHATLYLTAFPQAHVEEVRAIVAEIAAQTAPFPMRIDGYDLTPGNWLFLKIEENAALRALSDRVVEAVAHLRDPAYAVPGWVRGNAAKEAVFEAWGSPNVFGEFGPHLTQLAAEDDPALQRFLAEHDDDRRPVAEGAVVGIGFAPVNPMGQARSGDEVIWRFGAGE